MPEGDTIFRAAHTLNRALAGAVITHFSSVFPALERVHHDHPLTGRRVESVTSAGKHLLMRFEGELVLRTHLRMSGSWHLYRHGEPWRRSARDLRIRLETAEWVALAFNVHDAEFLGGSALERNRALSTLGPDLLAPDFDADEACRRIEARGMLAIESALLDQRALAGIGNVYKSEILFQCGIDPSAKVATLAHAQIAALVAAARAALEANVLHARGAMPVTYTGHRRTTRRVDPEERLWVYGRGGRPCRRCGTPIARRVSGPDARSTYWCPRCQAGR